MAASMHDLQAGLHLDTCDVCQIARPRPSPPAPAPARPSADLTSHSSELQHSHSPCSALPDPQAQIRADLGRWRRICPSQGLDASSSACSTATSR